VFNSKSVLTVNNVECQTAAVATLVKMQSDSFSNDDELGAAVSCIACATDRVNIGNSEEFTFVLYVADNKQTFRCVACIPTNAGGASSCCEEVFDVPVVPIETSKNADNEKVSDEDGSETMAEKCPVKAAKKK